MAPSVVPAAKVLWRIRRGDTEYGPYGAAIVRTWVQQGKIASDALLSDGRKWITLAEFLMLEQQSGSSAPSVPEASTWEPPPPVLSQPEVRPAGATAAASAPDANEPDDETPVRDRIVILGRSRSGKTIYLANLYNMLWHRMDGFSAKALAGDVHTELTNIVHELKEGRWPGATLGSKQIEFEITHNGRTRLLVTLDFAGELFARAFVHDRQQAEETKPLLRAVDHAAAVLLLADPAVVAGQDHAAAAEDDFGLVQAVQRIQNWPGGDKVPIVFVLTKADVHQHLLDQHGGTVGFVRHYFPALVRVLKQIPIFQVSAVQCVRDPEGVLMPRRDSVQLNIEKPLLYCLNIIDQAERSQQQQRQDEERRMAVLQQEREQRRREQRQVRLLAGAIAAIVFAGAVIIGLIIYYRF